MRTRCVPRELQASVELGTAMRKLGDHPRVRDLLAQLYELKTA
jgi:hypothetical protein